MSSYSIDRLKYELLPRYTKTASNHDYKVFTDIVRRVKPYISNIQEKKVIDIGCGIRFPFTLLFHSLGTDVTGIDIDPLVPGFNIAKYRDIWIKGKYKGLLIRLLNDFYQEKLYYRELGRQAGLPLKFGHLNLKQMDAGHTTFGDNEFDLVVSNSVFQYLKNPEQDIAEINRIMKNGAIAHIEFHLFTSLTGGHNTLWSNPDTREVILGKVPPWDHLRKQLYPISQGLNRLRESEWKTLFSQNFEILEWITEYEEPAKYLTPDLILELKGYSREELLKRAIVVVARKR